MKINLNKNKNTSKKMKIKQKKIEEGDADDQCSADMLLKGVIITV